MDDGVLDVGVFINLELSFGVSIFCWDVFFDGLDTDLGETLLFNLFRVPLL